MTEDNKNVTLYKELIEKHLKDNFHPYSLVEQAFVNTCRNTSLSDVELKRLKDKLGKEIFAQNEKADRRKPILLVGGNDVLVGGTLALLWNTHPLIYEIRYSAFNPDIGEKEEGMFRIWFVDKNCSGLSNEEIARELFHKSELSDEEREEHLLNHEITELIKPLINIYKRGAMLSLRGLESEQHKNILNRIIVEVEKRKDNYKQGLWVVSIDSASNLPEKLVKKFEVIELEAKKQIINKDTAINIIPFPTPPGTQWHEVKISFIDNENVSIGVRGGRSERKNYAEMGFKNKKTCKPVKSWYTLLAFSEKGCLKYSQSVKSKTEKDIQDLRKRLKTYFGIQGDPIILEGGYRPVFKVCSIGSESRSVHAFSNSNYFDEKEDD